MRKIIKNTVVILLTAIAVYYCLAYPKEIGESVKTCTDRCLTIILPSMFIFLCITTFISFSGIHKILGLPFKIIAEKVFRLPVEAFAIFLLSLVSGYPAGVKLTVESRKKNEISPQQGKIMSCICCCGGPAFISGTAAACLYPDSNASTILFTSIIFANIISAFLCTRALPRIFRSQRPKLNITPSAFVPAVRSSATAMMQMCIMILAFGGAICILRLSGCIDLISDTVALIIGSPSFTIRSVIMTFLEISNIVTLPAMDMSLFPIVTFLLSFGGICVVMQIISLSDKNFSVKLFLTVRLLTALTASLIGKLLMPLLSFNYAVTTVYVNANHQITATKTPFPIASIFLVIMMIMLMYSDNKDSLPH